jgi:hypothetical protein
MAILGSITDKSFSLPPPLKLRLIQPASPQRHRLKLPLNRNFAKTLKNSSPLVLLNVLFKAPLRDPPKELFLPITQHISPRSPSQSIYDRSLT